MDSAELIVNNKRIALPGFYFSPVGFGKDDALIPYPKNSHSGYRILQEYFFFKESFLFFDVAGVNRLEIY